MKRYKMLFILLALLLCSALLFACHEGADSGSTDGSTDGGNTDGGNTDGGSTGNESSFDKYAHAEGIDPYLYDFLDFTVDVEEGKAPVVLQITDPLIMDATQQRYEGRLSERMAEYFAPTSMDDRCFNYLKELVTETKPDLILVTGDMVFGEFDDNGSAFLRFVACMDSFGIPWAPVFGDRDNQSKMGVAWQCEQLEASKYCLFKRNTLTGNGNYAVGLVQGDTLLRTFVMLDSNGCSAASEKSLADGQMKTTFGFAEDQIEWYTETVKQIRILSRNTRFTFAFHAQLPEFSTAWTDAGYKAPLSIDTAINLKEGDFGYATTAVKGSMGDTVFSSIKTLKADSILVGNVPSNSASVTYNGVRLQYGQKCSAYDRTNYMDKNGNISLALYSTDVPLVGGTVMPIDPETGAFHDPYIHLCDAVGYTPSGDSTGNDSTYDKHTPVGGLDPSLYELLDFTVEVEEGKTPVVLQITDPQIIDASQRRYEGRLGEHSKQYWDPANKNARCYDYLTELFNTVKPDLILVTGDIIYGEFDDNGSAFAGFVAFMESFDIPWAPVFGNHENETNMGVAWQCELLEEAEYCLFKRNTLTGNGNYTVGLTQGGKLLRTFVMLDSNGCWSASEQSLIDGQMKTSFGFVKDQIDWYTETVKQIRLLSPSTRFTFAFHVQLPQFADAWSEAGYTAPVYIDGYEGKKEGDFGYAAAIYKSPMPDNIFTSLKELSVDSVLVGHEHVNSASVVYEGVRLQYGQKSSAYDSTNYVDANGNISTSYAPSSVPLIGGTVMPINTETGEFENPYIYLCANGEDALR